MRYRLLALAILSFTSLAYGEQNVFYDKITGKQIVDISAKKTKAQIAVEFNISEQNLQEMTINQAIEGVTVVNGVMVKKDLIAERESATNAIAASIAAKRAPAVEKLKSQGWSDEEIKSLLNE